MVLQLKLKSEQDYIDSLSKNIRINTKNSKKAAGIEKENCICKK
jgi:hypothetical protein